MHYNPASIKLARETVDNLGSKEQLGSVIIESCDIRWNDTGVDENGLEAKFAKNFLTNEMRAAHDTSLQYSRPVILGDQRINITGSRIGEITKQAVVDLASPFNGGWERFYSEVRSSSGMALPSKDGDDSYIGANGLLDPRLLLAMPATLVQYPLSWLIRAPLGTIAFGLSVFALNYFGDTTMVPADADLAERMEDVYSSLLFSAFETLLFARIFVTVMLAERNEVIAQNILEQCKIYSGKPPDVSSQLKSFAGRFLKQFPPSFGFSAAVEQSDTATSVFTKDKNFEIVYAPKSPLPDTVENEENEEKVVVAILGMAHCNGVFKLLKDELLD